VKRIGLILLAILVIALLLPALGTAQSAQTVTVTGTVYTGALPVNGAKVQIYSWDGTSMGTAPQSTTYTQVINGVAGSFEFDNVPYDPSKTFNWVVQAQNDMGAAHAMVYVLPSDATHPLPAVQPIILDLKMWDWKTDLTGMVQSGNMAQQGIAIPNANVSIYTRDSNGTIGQTPVATTMTGSDGQFDIKNILDYGQYQAVVNAVINNNHYVNKINFTAYQQQTPILATMTQIILATPTPTPTPSANKPGSGGGLFGIPGFEAILALAAIGGAALVLRRK
jgi:PGF-CTERM protein